MTESAIDVSALLQPFQLNGLTLRNRFIIPSMQRGVCFNGAPTPEVAAYYGRFAEGGFALVMSEGCAVDHPVAGHDGKVVRMTRESQAAWRECVQRVNHFGGHMFIQLWHGGGNRKPPETGPLSKMPSISPSGYVTATQTGGQPIVESDFRSLKDSYARSAVMAREIGAAGVELHACHGSLLDQFLWPSTNRREDEYGGEVEGRARFPAEVVAAIREAVGSDFVISFRFSQWKMADYETGKIVHSPEELGRMLAVLRKSGVDSFHASTRRFQVPEWPGSDLGLAGWTKSLTDAAVITVGGVGGNIDLQSLYRDGEAAVAAALEDPSDITRNSLKELLRRFARNEFDLVSVGRAGIGDPQWVNKIAAGNYDAIKKFEVEDLRTLIANFNSQVKIKDAQPVS